MSRISGKDWVEEEKVLYVYLLRVELGGEREIDTSGGVAGGGEIMLGLGWGSDIGSICGLVWADNGLGMLRSVNLL